MVQCPFCATAWEASVKLEEDPIVYGDVDPVTLDCIVPVWTCNVCEKSWTDHVAEAIREHTINEWRANLRKHP